VSRDKWGLSGVRMPARAYALSHLAWAAEPGGNGFSSRRKPSFRAFVASFGAIGLTM
jgi:hypothetical protein